MEGGGESSTKFSKKRGGLTGSQFLEPGVAGKERGCIFYIKNKLKSEIFNNKKVYKKMFFSVITKNLN